MLNDKGQCCGRKPLHYKGGGWRYDGPPQLFCCRCARSYNPETKEQQENWAWVQTDGEWKRK